MPIEGWSCQSATAAACSTHALLETPCSLSGVPAQLLTTHRAVPAAPQGAAQAARKGSAQVRAPAGERCIGGAQGGARRGGAGSRQQGTQGGSRGRGSRPHRAAHRAPPPSHGSAYSSAHRPDRSQGPTSTCRPPAEAHRPPSACRCHPAAMHCLHQALMRPSLNTTVSVGSSRRVR